MNTTTQGRPPARTTPLYTWMRENGVLVDELAARLHITPQHLSRIRTAQVQPSDDMKCLIADVTAQMDRDAQRRGTGVKVRSWFPRDKW